MHGALSGFVKLYHGFRQVGHHQYWADAAVNPVRYLQGHHRNVAHVNRHGIERIIEANPVPVIPMALQGLWGSFFSRHPHKGVFKRLWSRITLVAAAPVAPEAVKRERLQAQVAALRGERL